MLLRAAAASVLLVQGRLYLAEPGLSLETGIIGIAALIAGALLLVGFLTPLAAVLAALGAAGVGLSLLPGCDRILLDSALPTALAATILLAVLLIGPGAFSVDARLFGRREVIIPPVAPRR